MILEIFACDDRLCVDLESAADEALRDLKLARETTICRITDPASMVGRGVWRAPGLAVNGKVVSRGKPLSAARSPTGSAPPPADGPRSPAGAARQSAAARSLATARYSPARSIPTE